MAGSKRDRRIKRIRLGEIRPAVPERPRDNIELPIFVDVAHGHAVAIVFAGELLFLEPDAGPRLLLRSPNRGETEPKPHSQNPENIEV